MLKNNSDHPSVSCNFCKNDDDNPTKGTNRRKKNYFTTEEHKHAKSFFFRLKVNCLNNFKFEIRRQFYNQP